MLAAEPAATALLLTTVGVLLSLSVVFSRALGRVSVPTALIFLGLGMLAGSEGIGGIVFEDYGLALRLGTVALVLILFDGGLNTPLAAVRSAARPAGLLATVGVAATAGPGRRPGAPAGLRLAPGPAAGRHRLLDRCGGRLRGAAGQRPPAQAAGRHHPGGRVGPQRPDGGAAHLGAHRPPRRRPSEADLARLPVELLFQLGVGGALGVAIGFGGRTLLARLGLLASGLYPVITLALAFLAFGVPTLLGASGFLSVYVTAVILGNGALPYRNSLLRVHDALAWLAQIAMFLVLGLLVFPSQLPAVAGVGLGLAFFLAVIARPLVVGACLWPFGYKAKEVLYVGWVGLRGAVPIILATMAVLAGVS